MSFFLGIDGGGSKTRCLVGDELSLLGAGTSSSCKVQRVGEDCARVSLSAAVNEACVQAGISPRQMARTCAGVTGAARPEISEVMRELISGMVAGEIEVVGDVEVAFEDSFGAGPGVIVIAGTGSIAYGRSDRGHAARAGGWGHAISDEGSGYWIGAEATRAALKARDRGEDSALLCKLMEAMGAKDAEEFIVQVNANPSPDFAALFPVVLLAADRGDPVASEVLERAGIELANAAEIVIQRLFGNSEEISVAAHGGVLGSSEQVRKVLANALCARYPTARLNTNEIDAARGALNRARRGMLLTVLRDEV